MGIDGYSSNTVEQTGTDSDCVNGKPVYYAWFEFYPHPSFSVNSLTIQPGDVISAEVSAGAKGEFTVTLMDTTAGGTFSTQYKDTFRGPVAGSFGAANSTQPQIPV